MTQISRRSFVRGSATAATFTAIGSAGTQAATATPEAISVFEDFSGSTGAWTVTSDLDGSVGNWNVSLVQPSSMTSPAVQFVADGTAASGMAWIYAPVQIDPDVEYEGTITTRMWSQGATDDAPTDLCVYMGPQQPTTADDFLDPRESWFYEGPETGLHTPLWDAAGWTDYTCHWATPAFDTDTLYVAIGVQATSAGEFIHYLDAVDIQLAPATTTDEGISVQDISIAETDASFMGERAISFDESSNTVTVQSKLTLPTGCHAPVIDDSTYDPGRDDLTIELDAVDQASDDEACTQATETVTYELTATCEGGLPGSVTVTTPNGAAIAAANDPTPTSASLSYDGPTTTSPDALFDHTNNVVSIQDTVELQNGCQDVELTSVTFDATTDTLAVDADLVETGEACTQEYTEQPITVEVAFDGGLPGTVDYDGPSE